MADADLFAAVREPDILALTAPPTPASAGQVRRRVADHLIERAIPRDVVDAVRIAVSETVTNAIVHAYDAAVAPQGSITVEVRTTGRTVDLTVTDSGAGMTPRRDSPGAGIGLAIVARLASALDISTGADGRGTRVHARFD